jgi:hypothetical protein
MSIIKTQQGAVSAHFAARRSPRRRRPAVHVVQPPKLVLVELPKSSKAA